MNFKKANNHQLHNRQSLRIQGYDYSKPGRYFITLNVNKGMIQLGEITKGEMILNETGEIVEKCWHQIPEHYPDAVLHEFVIMPDHLHGIIELKRKDDADSSKNNIDVVVQNFEPRQIQNQKINKYQNIIPRSVGCIIRGFKIGVTKQLKKSIWQRNYYEHIIRSEASYKRIAQYIINNPKNWKDSKF